MVEVSSVLKLHCFPSKALLWVSSPFHFFTNNDKGEYGQQSEEKVGGSYRGDEEEGCTGGNGESEMRFIKEVLVEG